MSHYGPRHYYVLGTDQSDTIDVQDLPDGVRVSAYGGRDKVFGSKFADALDGGDGNDLLHGNGGDDRVAGGDGDDEVFGGQGNDLLHGDLGSYYTSPIGGADRIYGGDGNDIIFGEAGDDMLAGESGLDTLSGGIGNDSLAGGLGNDVLHGGDGADSLDGGDHDDRLEGGKGPDTLKGGAGADRFEYSAEDLTHATVTQFGRPVAVNRFEMDTILDFEGTTGDRIDLGALLDSASSFAGTTAADARAQSYIHWVQHGTAGQPGFGTTIYVDLNGGAHSALDTLTGANFALADLQGVAANQLNTSHFIV